MGKEVYTAKVYMPSNRLHCSTGKHILVLVVKGSYLETACGCPLYTEK